MADDSTRVIRQVEESTELPSGTLESELGGFQGHDLSGFSMRDIAYVTMVLSAAIGSTVGLRELGRIADSPERRLVISALRATRDRLLAEDSPLSLSAKDFIRDHCPC